MAGPSYRKRLLLLEEIFADGIKLFKMLHQSEEQLREQLVAGDFRALMETEKVRSLIKEKIASLEDRRRNLVPEEVSLNSYIRTMIARSRQPSLLAALAEIQEDLRAIRVINEVNRALLEERLRFSKELQESAFAPKTTYDQKGQLKNGEEGPPQNLDRNC